MFLAVGVVSGGLFVSIPIAKLAGQRTRVVVDAWLATMVAYTITPIFLGQYANPCVQLACAILPFCLGSRLVRSKQTVIGWAFVAVSLGLAAIGIKTLRADGPGSFILPTHPAIIIAAFVLAIFLLKQIVGKWLRESSSY